MSNNNSIFNAEELRSFVERVEHIENEEASLRADKKEIINEAKSAGYDPKYIKLLVKLRKMDRDEIDENDELAKMYRRALGL